VIKSRKFHKKSVSNDQREDFEEMNPKEFEKNEETK
jgi:hypothetical protein